MNKRERLCIVEQLRAAAKFLEKHSGTEYPIVGGMCAAIWKTPVDLTTSAAAEAFIRGMYFKSSNRKHDPWWYAPAGTELEARTLALYFAADVLESGEMFE